MNKFIFMTSCIASVAFMSIASAETLYIPGASGVRDQADSICSDPYVSEGEMQINGQIQCLVTYPIDLPAGKIIDSVEVAYDDPANAPGNLIKAFLGQNRVKPKLGTIAIAGASAYPKAADGQGFLNMSPLNVPVATGSVYWVQIFDQGVHVLNYVAVTYH